MGYKKRQPLPVVFVRTMRLELIQANAHYPLKVACLPFHHVRNTLGLQRYAQIYYSQIYFDFFAISIKICTIKQKSSIFAGFPRDGKELLV